MTVTFRPAVRENVGLILGVMGASGSGKTYSAMRLAKGMTPPGKRFAVIDTEAGRATHYADRFAFDHADLAAPYSPARYAEAIKAADAAGYPVIVVDSFSHEHAGDGGILDMQEEELSRMAGDNWQKREAVKMAAWVKPKMAHKKMLYALLQVRAHLILAFRAEEKIEMVKDAYGKMVIQPKQSLTGLAGWIPICEKNLPYELTASFLLIPDLPGNPHPIKLQEQHRSMVPKDAPLDEATGERLAAWARGGVQSTKGQNAAVVAALLEEVQATLVSRYPGQTAADKDAKAQLLEQAFGSRSWAVVKAMDEQTLRAGLEKLRRPAEAGRAQEADRGGNPPVTREHASHQEQQPAPKERPQEGDEPSPGLFPTAQELKPPRQAGPPGKLAGVDTPDEAQTLEEQIEAEKAKLERQPPDAIWEKLCEHVTGTTVLDMADPAALQQLLELVKGLVAEDPATIEKVTAIVSAA